MASRNVCYAHSNGLREPGHMSYPPSSGAYVQRQTAQLASRPSSWYTEPKPCYLPRYATRPHGSSPTAKPNHRPHSNMLSTHSTRHTTLSRLAQWSTSRASTITTAVGYAQGLLSKETSSYDSSKSHPGKDPTSS